MVGSVFVSEGIQKFLFAESLGTGRFAKIGIPSPEFFGPFVGAFEIACGSLLLLGFGTRLAAVPLVVVMCVAIATTKLPMLTKDGFWKMAHEARTDWSMLLGLLFLLIVGGGRWSIDALLSKVNSALSLGHDRSSVEPPGVVQG
jgi:putative oxidoreductase